MTMLLKEIILSKVADFQLVFLLKMDSFTVIFEDIAYFLETPISRNNI